MYSQKQMIEKGIEIGHWPTFEEHPHEKKHREHTIGSMVGMIYDTTGWPVPDEVYHPDNRAEWHCDDPNCPLLEDDQKEADAGGRKILKQGSKIAAVI